MAPIRSTIGRSVGKLLNTFRDRDLSLDSSVRTSRIIPPFIASGGTKATVNGIVYHVFTTSGAFTINTPNGPNANISLLMVAGGGGGGVIGGGGGGGGVIKSSPTIPIPQSGGPYPISIGQGGNSGGPGTAGSDGGDTTFSNPGGVLLTAKGGGGGGSHQASNTSVSGRPGGSGGGGSDNSGSYPYGDATQPTANPGSPFLPQITQFGNRGGNGPPTYNNFNPRSGGGGGGAAAAGDDRGNPTPYGNGGDGTPYIVLTNGDPSTTTEYWFGAGGGAGTYESGNSGNGGKGGAGGGVCQPGSGIGAAGPNGYNAGSPGGTSGAGGAAGANTGGGGGGGQWPGPWTSTRTGGPGIVVISYPTNLV